MSKIVSKINLVNKDGIEINPATNEKLDEVAVTISGTGTTVRLDEVDDTTFYVGKAIKQSLETDSVWTIIKYSQTGSILKSEYAPVNSKWSDRVTLTYN